MTSKDHGGPETAVARLETDEQTARKMASIFAECSEDDNIATTLVDNGGGRWIAAIHFSAPPDELAVRALAEAAAGAAAAQAITFERVAARDWVRESLAGLAPVEAGRFVVHGAHDRARVLPNRIGIEIEAALAFGTGHHGTTRGCLLALELIRKASSARRILDLGTGSGVLAIAAARALRKPVLATDVDGEAVRVARDNAWLNRVGPLIEMVQANGVDRQRVRTRAPFDLVFANILLGPLQRFAAPLKKLIAPGGRLVLSGLLASQASAALSAYRPLALERRITLGGWTTLILKRAIEQQSRTRNQNLRRRC